MMWRMPSTPYLFSYLEQGVVVEVWCKISRRLLLLLLVLFCSLGKGERCWRFRRGSAVDS